MKAFINSIAEMTGLPADMITGYRYIVFNGRGVFVEGIRGIRKYTETEITVAFRKGQLIITGLNLAVKHMNSDEILITGIIEKVENEAK